MMVYVGLRPAVRQEFRLRLFSFSLASQSLEFNNNVVSFTLCSTFREWTRKLAPNALADIECWWFH